VRGAARESFSRSGPAMIRFVLRSLGLLLVAAAFFFFVYDGTQWIANGKFSFTSLQFVWAQLNQKSLLWLQPMVEHYVPWLWPNVIQRVLQQPVWVVLTVIGAILMLLGRKKKPLIGYAR
jgi:hypothetical protein